ncbi:NTP transferase domain-containing protein [Sphingobium sp. BYY-5]|uniref:molybdenum cofactor guanylyltransferase n=1 Tax=Sphingobium sp. BYY-5 TaxID=2926400 RepID=UPI001FA77E94|nr:NTP transferase domain-containing protein [Sphingobium sp. BYY-5]MCI4589128.1 NTP transferase domain-containing protein [Sphingobium sp. BYY-5]
MRTLGVVLAGGKSSRFGSDKAHATLDGRELLDHALRTLSPYCDRIAVVGRPNDLMLSVPDWPCPGLGPLGGLAGGLAYAAESGFEQVLSIPVDCVRLPSDILEILDPAPACLEAVPVIGLWSTTSLTVLRRILDGGHDRSMRAFGRAIGARSVTAPFIPPNINTPADLAATAATFAEQPL